MITIERIENPDWNAIEGHPDAMVCHSKAWFDFLRETQRVEPVVLRLQHEQSETLFAGGIVKKFGVRILGSPFPGWTTSYMGLLGDVNRLAGIEAVREFSFRKLGIVQLECLDNSLAKEDIAHFSVHHRIFQNYLLDLSVTPDKLQSGLAKNAKGSLSTARQRGVTVTLNPPDAEFIDVYYDQLTRAFARQQLRPSYSKERVRALLTHLRPFDKALTGWSQDEKGNIVATNLSVGNQNRAALWGGTLHRDYVRLQPTELLQWEIILEWQRRGTRSFDFGGAGDYKRKYGGVRIETPFVRFSKYPIMESMRQWAISLQRWRQRQGVMPLDSNDASEE